MRDYWIKKWIEYLFGMDRACYYPYDEKLVLFEAEKEFPGIRQEALEKYRQQLRKKRK